MTNFVSRAIRHKSVDYRLHVHRVNSRESYQAHLDSMAETHRNRWDNELTLGASQLPFTTRGFCQPCQCEVDFETDFEYSYDRIDDKLAPNWRERVICPFCHLNNRTRASVQILEEILEAKRNSSICIAEQVTPLYALLKARFPQLVGSEYLGSKVSFGSTGERGVRNESITKLTFDDDSFDVVLNFDVLEHIPNPKIGLGEIFRVLKPGGRLLLSVPFMPHLEHTQVRATISPDGDTTHHLPPQYHGDPVSEDGCLCFQDFGWDLLVELKRLGFSRVEVLLYWSDVLGYFGVEQNVIFAQK